MSPAAGLALLLALSVAGNAWVARQWLSTRAALATAVQVRDAARASASACSDATAALQRLADTRAAEARAARATAAQAARALQQAAQAELATPPTVPGNDCQSATDRAQRWLARRAAATGVHP